MLKFLRVPFAQSGDRAAVPDAVTGTGDVSYTEGWGADYSRPKTDPLSKNIPREKSNQLMFDVTTAVGELQAQGVPDFITTVLNGGTPFSYAKNALVRWTDGNLYRSLAAANTALPSDATKWAYADDRFLQTGTGAQERTETDKLTDIVSIFDFLTPAQKTAVKNRTGSVGVSAAIMAAANSRPNGCTVEFPEGRYYLDMTTQFLKKVKLLGAAMSETQGRNPTVQFVKGAAIVGAAILFAGGSSGSIMEGIELDGESGNQGDGVVILTNSITLRNVSVYGQQGWGCRIGKNGFGANANNWYLDRVNFNRNGLGGYFVNDKYDSSLTGAITSGTNAFTASGAFFEASAVGYPFTVRGAGVSGADLVTTIATYVSPTQVTLTANASTTVGAAEFFALPDANVGTAIQPTANQNLGDGAFFQNCALNTVVGVHAEQNGSYGLHLGKLTYENKFFGGDLAEGNVVDFVADAGSLDNWLLGVPYASGADNSGRNMIFKSGRGTFTPTLNFTGGNTGLAYTGFGEFMILGNRLKGSGAITMSAKGSVAGSMQITNLPFNMAAISVNGMAHVIAASSFTGLTGAPNGYVGSDTKTLNFQQSAATGFTDITAANVTNTTNIQFAFDYPLPV